MRVLQSWGLGKRLLFSRSDILLAGVGRKAWKWQESQWTTSTGPLSNVDLWTQLVDLLYTQLEPVVFVKLGTGGHITEYLRAEQLVLEALCSHPQKAGRGRRRRLNRAFFGRIG